jgi:uncharacterized membrane protein YfcA
MDNQHSLQVRGDEEGMPYAIEAILVGLAAGYLSGQFGVGGGIITTPGIRLVLGKPAMIALGTPLLIMIPTVVSGAYVYRKNKLINSDLVLPLSTSGILGIIIGSAATAFVSANFLMLLTAFIIFILGLRFMASQMEEEEERPRYSNYPEYLDPKKLRNRSLLVGLGCSFFAGFLGLGGGILLVPALNILLKQNIKKAFGTSLVVIAIYAVPGAIVHLLLKHIDLKLAFLLILGVVPGAYLGAKATVKLPASFVKSLFGLFLMAVSIYFAYYEILAMMLSVRI